MTSTPLTSSIASSRVIAHEKVLRYVYEFLDENGYQQALRALQAESKVPYNVLHTSQEDSAHAHSARSGTGKKEFPPPSERGLETAVMEGSWAEVLHVYVDGLLLPEEVKATLYEVILEEMVELHGLVPAARSLLLNAPAFQLMKTDTPARYIRLQKLVDQGQRTMSEATGSGTAATRRVTPEMRQRRTALLQQLKTAIRFSADAPVGRLAAALARASAAGSAPGSALLTFAAAPQFTPSRKREREEGATAGPAAEEAWADTFLQYPLAAPKEVRRRLPYGEQQAACCCAPLLLGDAKLLLVGRADGVVDVVDTETGQASGAPLRHTEGVLVLARDAAEGPGAGPEWIAVGYRDGWVKVYNMESRRLVRRFERVHTTGVTALFFAGSRAVDGLSGHHVLLVTGSFDGSVRVLDIAAGSVVCTVANSHASAFVHAVLPLSVVKGSSSSSGGHADDARDRFCFLSSGNDGTLAVWRVEDGRDDESGGGVVVQRVQEPVPLGQLHGELRDAVPTQLYSLQPPSGASSAVTAGAYTAAAGPPASLFPAQSSASRLIAWHDVLVLTRAGQAFVCRLAVHDEGSNYYSCAMQVLCLIATTHPLRSAFPHVHHVVSLSVPLLSLYAADTEGTVSLHNIEMKWYNAEQWAEFGGCMKVRKAADQSPVVIVEVGKAVKDLCVTCAWPASQHQPASVIAYGPSLSAVYDIW